MRELKNSIGDKCSEAQYLSELVCKRKSQKQKIPMSARFWNDPEWKTYYVRQVTLAHGLLKLFDFESIIAALTSKEGNWIFSLSYPKLTDIIRTYINKEEKQQVKIDKKKISFEDLAVQEVAQIRKKKNVLEDLE